MKNPKNDPAISLRIQITNLPYPNFFHENSELDDMNFKNQYIMTVSGTYRGVTKLGAKNVLFVTKLLFLGLTNTPRRRQKIKSFVHKFSTMISDLMILLLKVNATLQAFDLQGVTKLGDL